MRVSAHDVGFSWRDMVEHYISAGLAVFYWEWGIEQTTQNKLIKLLYQERNIFIKNIVEDQLEFTFYPIIVYDKLGAGMCCGLMSWLTEQLMCQTGRGLELYELWVDHYTSRTAGNAACYDVSFHAVYMLGKKSGRQTWLPTALCCSMLFRMNSSYMRALDCHYNWYHKF